MIENVPGLITSHGGKDLDAICDALTDADHRLGASDRRGVVRAPMVRADIHRGDGQGARRSRFIVAASPSLPFHPPGLSTRAPTKTETDLVESVRSTRAQHGVRRSHRDRADGVAWHTRAETDRLIGMMAPLHIAKLDDAKRDGKRMVGGLYKRTRDQAGGSVQRVEIRFDDIAGCLRDADRRQIPSDDRNR